MFSFVHSSRSENRKSSNAWPLLGLLFATLTPAALIAILVARYGVDVPYWDEWSLVELFQKSHTHQLSWADLFAQSNEHRIVFPKLIFLGLEHMVGWRPRVEMFVSLVFCTLSGFGFVWLLRRTLSLRPLPFFALSFLCSALLFSPSQSENWLWGYQLAFFLLVLCVVVGNIALCSELPLLVRLSAAGLCAFVATFSGGNGMLLWPLFLFCFLLREQRLPRARLSAAIGCWLLAAAATTALYLVHYRKPASHPPLVASRNALDYLRYLIGFHGSALGRFTDSNSMTGPLVVGTLLLAVFCAFLVMVATHSAIRRAAAPWLTIAGFSFMSAVLACITRIGFGSSQALASRYTTFSIPFIIALLPLGVIAQRAARERMATLLRAWNTAFPCVVALLFLITLPSHLQAISKLSERRARGQTALLFIHLAPDQHLLEASIFPDLPVLSGLASIADSFQLLHPRLLTARDIEAMASSAPNSTRACGSFTKIEPTDEQTRDAIGWARHPRTHRIADGIILTYLDENTQRKFLTASFERFKRAQTSTPPGMREWKIQFDRRRLPSRPTTLEAWAFGRSEMSLCKLEGTPVAE